MDQKFSPERLAAYHQDLQPARDIVATIAKEDASRANFDGDIAGNFHPERAVEVALPMYWKVAEKHRNLISRGFYSMYIPGDENWHQRIFGKKSE